jgi:hypothetical protein
LLSSSICNRGKDKAGSIFSGTLRSPGPCERYTHLHVKPFLYIPVVGLHHGLILTSHLLQHPSQVHRGRSIHLNVKAVTKLVSEDTDFLKRHKDKCEKSHRANSPPWEDMKRYKKTTEDLNISIRGALQGLQSTLQYLNGLPVPARQPVTPLLTLTRAAARFI